MIEPRPIVIRFATEIVRSEIRAGGNVQTITARLSTSLSKLVGAAGFDVLLARSLVVAGRSHPLLEGVVAGSGGALEGFEGRTTSPDSEVEEAAVALVSTMVELLAVLVGETLALRLVGDVAQDGSSRRADSLEEEKK